MTTQNPQHCIVHYDEIALKGRNRALFENQTIFHLRRLLQPCKLKQVSKPRGRILLMFNEYPPWEQIIPALSKVFGVAHAFPVYACSPSLEEFQKSLLESLPTRSFKSFGVKCRRTDKKFPASSQEIKIQIGNFIREFTRTEVNLDNPDCWVEIEVAKEAIYYGYERHEGPRGLPIPVSGKVVTLLSGGIDSPVASYQMMRRGCENIFVHFHSSPLTSLAAIEKVRKIVNLLSLYQGPSKLYLVPFSALQRQIVAFAPASLRVLLYRRAMVRIAEKIAQKEKAEALVTGDNLGQVASQTLPNLASIEKACLLPILRPLLCFDKIQIVELAKKIETYPLSILPDQDCCRFMLPEFPATRAPLSILEKVEGDFSLQAEMDQCLQQTSLEFLDPRKIESLKT